MNKFILIFLIFLTPLTSFAFNAPENINCEIYQESDNTPTGIYAIFTKIPNTNFTYSHLVNNGEESGGDYYNEILDKWQSIDINFSSDGEFISIDYLDTNHNFYAGGCVGINLIENKKGVLFGKSGESGDIINGGAGTMLASVGFVTTNTYGGLFPYIMLSIGVFVSFYIIQELILVTSGEKEKVKKEWSGKGVMEHEYNQFKKKAKSRARRGLDIE